jgi:hypothetical protein
MPGNKVVKIVLSEPAFDRIAAAAAAREQSVSEFIRSAVRSELASMESRSKDANHTLSLIRALATGASGPTTLAQNPLPFEPKAGE